jgi:hypothetical protein
MPTKEEKLEEPMPPKFAVMSDGSLSPIKVLAKFKPGLHGVAPQDGPGVEGDATVGDGVQGWSDSGAGVSGSSTSGPGLWGYSKTGPALWVQSGSGEGVHAELNSASYAVAAYNKLKNPLAGAGSFRARKIGPGGAIYGEAAYGHAGYFAGHVKVDGDFEVTGNITGDTDIILGGQDCAEHFETAEHEAVEPGMVMVLGDGGTLQRSCKAYDKRVVGIVSGAGGLRPAVILGRQEPNDDRKPIALTGRVFCRVDANYGAIEMGDLLTTSDTVGHAMKATDPMRAFGAVLGKAMGPLPTGQGLIPVLVGLL